MQSLRLPQPDDWHCHLRDAQALATTVPATARVFARAIAMPNLKPPVTTVADAQRYFAQIQAHIPEGNAFQPLMTLYLTDQTSPEEIIKAAQDPCVHACKLYPAGATTHSAAGVTDLSRLDPVFDQMQQQALPLLIHGESTDPAVDIFDREAVFIEQQLMPLQQRFPTLRIVLEHITTEQAVAYVRQAPANVAATITVHHLLYNRNHLLVGGCQPHYYCLPILKRSRHQHALIEAATSGNPKFFLGTDSAPHIQSAKESSCGCAGIFSAPAAIELYAEVFEQAGKLDKLAGFASHYGADFYGLPRNTQDICLQRQAWQMPKQIAFAGSQVIPIAAGQTLNWQVCEC